MGSAESHFSTLGVVLAAATLCGCSSFSPDAGMNAVRDIAAAELNKDAIKTDTEEKATAAQARARRLLLSPLSANAVVEIALLNNKGLQAAYNDLGMVEAAKVEASLPPNPTFSASGISTAVELDIEGRIVANVLALATLPARTAIADERFRQAQLAAAAETLRVGIEARRSYYRAVAARALVNYLAESVNAAETSAKLADQLSATGAMNKLDQAREQTFAADVQTQLATARQQAASSRELLVRTLGQAGSDLKFQLPQALPPLPRRLGTFLPSSPKRSAAASIFRLRALRSMHWQHRTV
jgi:outer membrane protein TolC